MPKKEKGFMGGFAQTHSNSEQKVALTSSVVAPSPEENIVRFSLNEENQLVISFANKEQRWHFTQDYRRRLVEYQNSSFSKNPSDILELVGFITLAQYNLRNVKDFPQTSEIHVKKCDKKPHKYGFKIEGNKVVIVFDSHESRNAFAQALGFSKDTIETPSAESFASSGFTVKLPTIHEENSNEIIINAHLLRRGFSSDMSEFKCREPAAIYAAAKPEPRVANPIDFEVVQAIILANAHSPELQEMGEILSKHPAFESTPEFLTSAKFFEYLNSARLIMNPELINLIKDHIIITLRRGTTAEKKCYLRQILNSDQVVMPNKILVISREQISDEHVNNFIRRIVTKKPLALDKETGDVILRNHERIEAKFIKDINENHIYIQKTRPLKPPLALWNSTGNFLKTLMSSRHKKQAEKRESLQN